MHYRKIWENAYGKIPDGLEIHHIDGNRSNNELNNLKLVTLQEHLEIHMEQGDYGAVQAIMIRMESYDRTEIAKLAYLSQKNLIESGNHNFQKINRSELSKKVMKERLAAGSPAFLGIFDTKENSRKAGLAAKEKKAGFHNPEKTGGVFVKNTYWWTNQKTGERIRTKECPGNGWKRGMK